MVPNTLLLFASNIILQGLGAQNMYLTQPLSPKLQLGSVQTNSSLVARSQETNFPTIKEMQPTFQNYSLENRTLQEINVNKLHERLNNFEHISTEKHSKSLLHSLKQNNSLPTTKLNSAEKHIIMNQGVLMLHKNNSIQIDSTTNKAFTLRKIISVQKLFEQKREDLTTNVETSALSTISDDINVDSTENLSFQPTTNLIIGSKKISIIDPSVKSSITSRINKSVSYGSKFLNLNVQQSSNMSWKENSECCVGKYSQNLLEYAKSLNKTKTDEGKLNKQYKELRSSEKMSKSDLNNGKEQRINEFTKAKQLMLGYFESFNIKSSAVENGINDTVMGSQNMFELMEKSSKLINEILEAKNDDSITDEEEPSYFMKNMVEKQIEKCNGNYSLSKYNVNGTIPTRAKVEYNERLMDFIKCVNVSLHNCVIYFDLWLRIKKYYLRPRFNFTRAYKSFVKIHFLSCG